jgi:formate dehydrogenase subunit delta
MSPEKLAYIANQIGHFFAHQTQTLAVAAIEVHLRNFWDPAFARAEAIERLHLA